MSMESNEALPQAVEHVVRVEMRTPIYARLCTRALRPAGLAKSTGARGRVLILKLDFSA